MTDGKECLLRDHNNKMFFVIIKVKVQLGTIFYIAFGEKFKAVNFNLDACGN
jgi:hypothetical protein